MTFNYIAEHQLEPGSGSIHYYYVILLAGT